METKTTRTTKTAPKKDVSAPSKPNENLPLADIDYQNLTGEAFNNYQKVTEGLFLNDKYDFEVWKAQSIQKFKINEDTGKSEAYINGIRLNSNQPLERTRIKWSDALELNKQVSHNAAEAGTSKYYLLAKPQA